MITKYQMGILKQCGFDLGKFYIALDAKDDNGINWTTFYAEKLAEARAKIKTLEAKLVEWDVADVAEKEEIVRESIWADDQVLIESIDKEKETVKELSRILHEVNLMPSEDLDTEFFSESKLLTELMEEISIINESISEKRQLILDVNYDLAHEVESYSKDIEKDLMYEKNIEEECIKNQKLMDDRHDWYMKTFNISKDERDAIIEKFGNTEDNS